MTRYCRWCPLAIVPCQFRTIRAHLDRAPCKGWIHVNGQHGPGHTAEPKETSR